MSSPKTARPTRGLRLSSDRVTDLLARARAAHPSLVDADPRFIGHLRVLVDTGPPLGAHAGDLLLAFLASQGDGRAIAIIDGTSVARLSRKSLGVRASDDLFDEVRQRVRVAVLAGGGGKPLMAYRGRGSLRGYIATMARRIALEMLRESASDHDHEDVAGVELSSSDDVERQWVDVESRERFRELFHDAVRRLTLEERDLLRMHYLEGVSLDALSDRLSVSRATVGRRVVRARTKLAELKDARAELALADVVDALSIGRILVAVLAVDEPS